MFGVGPGDCLVLMAHPKRGIALQRQNLMLKIAEKILDGQGQDMYPGEDEENLEQFATIVLEEAQNGCD